MHLRGVCMLAAAVVAALAGRVRADDEPGAQPVLIVPAHRGARPLAPEPELTSHAGQFGLSVRFAAIGLSTVKPYKDTDYCGSLNSDGTLSAVCLTRLPVTIELEPSYGVSRHAELIAELGIGLESDFAPTRTAPTSGPHMFYVAPGARFFFSEGRHSKLFTTAQAVVDLTSYVDATGKSRGDDLGVRNLNGFWYDLTRNYGLCVFVGETAEFARWLRLDLEAGIGVQARFP